MFNVDFFENNKRNKWLIRQFELFRLNESFIAEKFVPRPDISIMFHFRDTPFILEDNEIQLEPFFATPILSKSISLYLYGEMDTFIAVCKPTVFSRIFDVNLSSVPKYGIALSENIFYPLWVALSKMNDIKERINYFTNFINSIQKTEYIPDAIDKLYDKIINNSTKNLLKDIIIDCPICQRTLERNFIKPTGVTPKMLMRIVRVDYLWTKINLEKAVDYQDLIFDGHYFDQAHLIKDFQSIIGETPGYFFNRNLNIIKMFSGRIEGRL